MVTSAARNNLYPFTSWGRIYSCVRTLVRQTKHRFLEGQCRVEPVVFMYDDVVVLLDGRPSTGYIECGRTTIDSLVLTTPDGWIGCEESSQVEKNDLIVCRCVGDWESEGLLATKSKSKQHPPMKRSSMWDLFLPGIKSSGFGTPHEARSNHSLKRTVHQTCSRDVSTEVQTGVIIGVWR